ncbi:DivIVA domain-containing protein, partial [Amycolatopsis tucumanensis]
MTAVDAREDLVPLRTDFDRTWRGYDARQVQAYVRAVETDLRMVIADRDAAAAAVERLAAQLEDLRS